MKILNDTALSAEQRREAVEVFVDGFGHMFTFAKTRSELVELFTASFVGELIYVCITDDGHAAGILGIGTSTQRAIKFDKTVCRRIFGKGKGNMVYRIFRTTSGAPAVKNPTDLYIDYLATSAQMRGQGIASAMLKFAGGLPGYSECYLDVLSKNTNALRLYEKLGFERYKKGFNFFTLMQGLGQPIKMRKKIQI